MDGVVLVPLNNNNNNKSWVPQPRKVHLTAFPNTSDMLIRH